MANIQEILGAVNSALNVIKTVADTPGVNLIPYVSTVAKAVDAVQAGVKAGINVAPYVVAISETFSGGTPSQEKLDALDAKLAELEAKVDAPLPAPEPGETQ